MNESMLDRLVSMENRYEELGHMLILELTLKK